MAFGLVAIIWAVVQGMYPLIPPLVGWLIVFLLVIPAAFLLIAGIKGKEIQKSLVLTPHAWAIGLSGMTGYPAEPENIDWLLLEVFVNPVDKPIDALDLVIDDKTIPANQWLDKIVNVFNVHFNVTEWRWKGKNQVELFAYVGDKKYRSGRITIDFNVEPFGSHRI